MLLLSDIARSLKQLYLMVKNFSHYEIILRDAIACSIPPAEFNSVLSFAHAILLNLNNKFEI